MMKWTIYATKTPKLSAIANCITVLPLASGSKFSATNNGERDAKDEEPSPVIKRIATKNIQWTGTAEMPDANICKINNNLNDFANPNLLTYNGVINVPTAAPMQNAVSKRDKIAWSSALKFIC